MESQVASFVHPTAEVSPDATLGFGVKVWHQSQVLPGAVVGDGTTLGKGVYVDRNVYVGRRSKIQNYALLYRGAILEDEVMVGPNVVLANDLRPRATNPDGSPKTDADWEEQGVHVGRGASIGAMAVVLPGVIIGNYALVGAGAVVTRDVPAYTLAVGCPARSVGLVCVCARGLNADLRCSCGRQFRRDGDAVEFVQTL